MFTASRWVDPWRGHRTRLADHATPARLFALSFAALIALGTLGLRWLPGLYVGERLGWVDALFTSTSAVCVTGLIVVDTATHFSFWGQLFLLLLIQLGGLGMVTFTSAIILSLGGRLRMRHEVLTASGTDVAPHVDFRQLAGLVVRFTLLLEGAAAVVLWLLWGARFGWLDSLWHAIFHSISAFCNAGFSTFSDSLMSFRQNPITFTVIMVLIVAGGIGFLTVEELRLWLDARSRRATFRLSLHSRLAVSMSVALIVLGWILLGWMEWQGALAGLPTADRIVNALFASVTTRTAGFNSIDYSSVTDTANFFTVMLMSIGGSPGSTAGGLKTTTVAVLAILAWSRLRGQPQANFFGRSIPEETVQRAVGLFVVGFVVVTLAILVLAATEAGVRQTSHSFLSIMFEAVSAFNTVGLSMGVTAELSVPGRLVTTLLMFIGRVGPLTFAAAIALRARSSRREFRYAHEDVVIG